jgi:serine/threonine-protein kinase
LAGESLDRWNDGPRSLGARVVIALKVARALSAAHEAIYLDDFGFEVRGILHGDIKPATILVTRDDEPKLLDFLLIDAQRLLDLKIEPDAMIRRPRWTSAMGTPGFMAPEQEKEGLLTAQADIYSLGQTFLRLFSWPGTRSSAGDEFVSREVLPMELQQLLSAMTRYSPRKRTKTARLVVKALAEIVGSL